MHVINHFKDTDPVLYDLSQRYPLRPLPVSRNYFLSLVEIIIGQQLSNAAANTIYKNVTALFRGRAITPQAFLGLSDEVIRKAGPSLSKVQYLKGFARCILAGSLNLDTLSNLKNDEVIQTLTKVRGIGSWTAEMFLMFTLGREDVFSHGDLGLRKAIRRLYRKRNEPSRAWIDTLTRKWSPYRTYACMLLWKSLDIPESEAGVT